MTPRTSLHHFHFPFLHLGPRSGIRQRKKKLCRLALRCCGENRGRSLAFVTAEISLSGAEVFNYGISVVSGFKAAFSLLLFCITSRLFFCMYDPIGPCVCVHGCDMMPKKQDRAFQRCFVLNQRTEPQIDLVELSLDTKLLLWSTLIPAYLPWSGQWIFSAWSSLKDTTRHLRLSPRAPQSFDINHSKGANPTWKKLYFQTHILHFLPSCGSTAALLCQINVRLCSECVSGWLLIAFTEELVRPRSVLGKPTIVNYISELQWEHALVRTIQLRGNSWR